MQSDTVYQYITGIASRGSDLLGPHGACGLAAAVQFTVLCFPNMTGRRACSQWRTRGLKNGGTYAVASIPMGQGGRVPPNIYFGGDMPINVPPNIWEFLFLKHQYLAAT